MTDNEIIKALENAKEVCDYDDIETIEFFNNALDLINCQKAEIERLNSEVKEKTETIDFLKDQVVGWNNSYCELKTKLETAKAEAIKEFVERLKTLILSQLTCSTMGKKEAYYLCLNEIDNLVKEMTE